MHCLKENSGAGLGLRDKMSWNFQKNWPEILFLVLLIVGVVFSLAAPSAVLSYLIVFCAGMMGGRLIYLNKTDMIFPYVLILVGFLIGYLIGARYGSWLVTVVLFMLGSIFSYYLHDGEHIKGLRLWP